MKAVTLSPKHGLNPAIPKCFLCLKDKNEIILAGKLKDDAEAPRGVVWDDEPCDECKGFMNKGIILISVDPKRSEPTNPYRTGGWIVVAVEYVKDRVPVDEETRQALLSKRAGFIEDNAWDAMGFPRGADP